MSGGNYPISALRKIRQIELSRTDTALHYPTRTEAIGSHADMGASTAQ